MMYRIILSVFLWIPALIYSQGGADLKITVTGIKDQGGQISVNLFNTEKGFPEDATKAFLYKTIQLNSSSESIYFIDLPPGRYAFAILHDANENGVMEKNFLGIPKEGFAFSNNYKPLIKSPSFSQAAFELTKNDTSLVVEMIYFL